MSHRVMLHVQHLLGIGHLKRASILAQTMARAGLDVSVVLGGREVPGVEFEGCARILLPPVYAVDETFRTLLDEDGRPIDDAWRDHRAARLLFEFEALRPHVLIVELFPFGRRMFAFELLPLLEAARAADHPCRILCSLRDILVRKPDAERNRKAAAFAHTWFDRILVHGDPRLLPIEASFPEMRELADKLTYTGYVVADDRSSTRSGLSGIAGTDEVIVSAGGGAVGGALLTTALAARPLSRLRHRVWRLVTGPNLPDDAFQQVAAAAPPGVIVERWRDDLPALFGRCAVSVSQAGYNTVMDLLRARARAVLVPFAAGGETEQSLRARILAERGLAVCVEPTPSPEILAAAVDEALTLSLPSVEIDLTGAETTARLVGALCGPAGET